MLQSVLPRRMGRDIASMLGGTKVAKPKTAKREVSKNAGLAASSFPARWRVEGSHCITNFPEKKAFGEYVKDQGQDVKKLKLACFDLDGTLVKTRSGSSFARSPGDWVWFTDKAKQSVAEQVSKGYLLVIFTNQGGVVASEGSPSKSYTNLKERVNQVVTSLGKDVPYPLVVAAPKRPKAKQKIVSSEEEHQHMRKPGLGMWEKVEEYLEEVFDGGAIDKQESFYVGDAAGRELDFSDSDKAFAEAVKVKFYTPEEFFQ
ncbi:hypothetical protein FT663_00719 [Candidozyma haemuli var. vulneris]|uniref:DNA 3'-phosphatase n=1 Tax=Candidozyma haemuli TaxID=45357 RepID=A0A2V1ANH7_9ASCO|nr:DNA 3'-phosphatase [[Candida] haemuloni]KAF3992439.1 hypothetical protein FT662_01148 [[Candida] haemuloni var. vulneris]KAF3995176.1 hypothetical protein FT663_00719 [[Candida] haemuloni var. vulneris]PVH19827.1 DNA 3'-phosphatase [[Candida] haemuloni]